MSRNRYVLIVKDKFLAMDGDCKIYGSDLNKLKQEGVDNVIFGPKNVTAKIWKLTQFAQTLIFDCNSLI